MKLQELVENQVLSPTLIAEALRTTKPEIATMLGLDGDALSQASRIQEPETQTRLREMTEILDRVEAQIGDRVKARTWFCSEPLIGFGGLTPGQLVREGKADHVRTYLDRIMVGGYA